MKTIAMLSFLGLIALTSNAQTTSGDAQVTISGAKSASAETTRGMSADQFNQFAGSYELANGDSLALFTRGLKKFAALHGEAWHELVATSANSFVAKDHQMKIDIVREENGVVHGDLYLPKGDMQTAEGKSAGELVKVAFH